jgi:hypothetical protein
MKKFIALLCVLVITATCNIGCMGRNNDNSAAPTSSILGNMTGTGLNEDAAAGTIMLTVSTVREAINAFYAIPEMKFEDRSRAMKVWVAVFKKELAAAKTCSEAMRLLEFVPPQQRELQQEAQLLWESLWRQLVTNAKNCSEMYSAYQMQPYWLQNETPRFQDWKQMAREEIAKAVTQSDLINLQMTIPPDSVVESELNLAALKLFLAEELEKAKNRLEINKLWQEIQELGFGEKG